MTPNAERVPAPTLLAFERVSKRFGGLAALAEVSFGIARGAIFGLIGPNGAGKTTVFNCITGFYKPTEGRLALQHGHQFGGTHGIYSLLLDDEAVSTPRSSKKRML